MVTADDVELAAARIAPRIRRTPLLATTLAERNGAHGGGARLAIKAEHLQHTGSFKIRGALNRLAELSPAEREAGVVAASSGNHGLAVLAAAAMTGTPVTVVVPAKASAAKIGALRRRGATVITVDDPDALAAEARGRELAAERGCAYIPPYNDPAVIAGQGTIAPEIVSQLPNVGWERIDAVVVAVGGGGLISGIATWMKAHTDAAIIAAQPANDPAMHAAVRAGQLAPIDAEPTLSDGTAGGVEPDAVTVDICRDLVDEWLLLDEREIASGVAAMIDHHRALVEGAAGLAVAAAVRYAVDHPGQHVVALSCGANISSETLREALTLAAG